MVNEKLPRLSSLLSWVETVWLLWGKITLSGILTASTVLIAYVSELKPIEIFVYGFAVFVLLWVIFEQFSPALFKYYPLKLWRGLSWDFNRYVISVSSARSSVGTSEDIMIYNKPEYKVKQFQLRGRNNSGKPIEKVSGFLRSEKTNLKIPLLLEGYPPDQTYGIPRKCEFMVRAIFPRSDPKKEGYTIDDFWRHVGEFTFVFQYNDKQYEKKFTKKMIEKLINGLIEEAENHYKPKDMPRVKVKQ